MMQIFKSDEINAKSPVGQKTKNLKKLIDWQLQVPPFVALPSGTVSQLVDRDGRIQKVKLEQLAGQIIQKFPQDQYSVRSSALIEDSKTSSQAGQFKTVLNITGPELSQGIEEVVLQAFRYLEGELNLFSIIIQEYIDADWAGICFTRNPLGSRELILEYYRGIGEKVVGGQIVPQKFQSFWTSQTPKNVLPNISSSIDIFKKIEDSMEFPQDIEWCIKNKVWYFLQTRPITSLNQDQYRQFKYLDFVLPPDQKYYYEKTEISEISPRPTIFTQDLLKLIYRANGPVMKVYSSLRIKYEPRDFLKIIGNELLIDREEELKSLMPAFSYLSSPKIKPKVSSILGLAISLKNLLKFNSFKVDGHQKLFEQIKNQIEKFDLKKDIDFSRALENLLTSYELVFRTNLFTDKALTKLANVLKCDKSITVADILTLSTNSKFSNEMNINLSDKNLWGNSLEIADQTKFQNYLKSNQENHDQIATSWWAGLPSWKQTYYQPFISRAVAYSRLREYGRWLVVMHISLLRKILLLQAEKNKFKNLQLIFFSHINELLSSKISEKVCVERQKEWNEYNNFNLPKILSHNIHPIDRGEPEGVSAGVVQGQLVGPEDLTKGSNILFVKILSPDLVNYFDKVNGIISEEGGMLSHLAIMAREKGLPVIVNVQLSNTNCKIGDIVEINGSNGQIKKL